MSFKQIKIDAMSEVLCAISPMLKLHESLSSVGVEIDRPEMNAPYEVLDTCMEIVNPKKFDQYGKFKMNEDFFHEKFREICLIECKDTMRNEFSGLLGRLFK